MSSGLIKRHKAVFKQIDRQTIIQMYRKIDRQINRQTENIEGRLVHLTKILREIRVKKIGGG